MYHISCGRSLSWLFHTNYPSTSLFCLYSSFLRKIAIPLFEVPNFQKKFTRNIYYFSMLLLQIEVKRQNRGRLSTNQDINSDKTRRERNDCAKIALVHTKIIVVYTAWLKMSYSKILECTSSKTYNSFALFLFEGTLQNKHFIALF